ncbi:hypothetical protein BST61_g6930 [Cercospora zeina]
MRLLQSIFYLVTLFALGQALALPATFNDITEASRQLFKRKGGGGGGGRGGGGGGSSRGSSSSSSSSSSSRGSSSSSSGRASGSSNTGGATRAGSGPSRGYGGGRFYGGGSPIPYTAGQRRVGIGAPLLLGAGALLVFPAFAAYGAYGAYSYAYPYYWNYRNESSGRNESHPAQCWCSRFQPCSCDPNNETDYQNSVANNATQAKLVRLDGENNDTLVVDGTLPNGHTTDESIALDGSGTSSQARTKKISFSASSDERGYPQLFLDFELTPYLNTLSPPQLEDLTNAIKTRWDTTSEFRRNERGRLIEEFHEARKARSDAKRQVSYARRYRGASDDEGKDIWRPWFGLYEEKVRRLVSALRDVVSKCERVYNSREMERRDDGVGKWLAGLLTEAMREANKIETWMRRDFEALRKEAEVKARKVEEKRRVGGGEEEDVEMVDGDWSATEQRNDSRERKDGNGGDGSGSNDNRVWHGTVYLGGGSFGAAFLWLQVDETTGKIVNRVVCKKASYSQLWNSPHYWTNGAPGVTDDISDTLPSEIQVHLSLRGRPGSRSTVEMLNYNLRLEAKAADLYLEFCPFGDAFEHYNGGYGYRVAKQRKRFERPWEDHSKEYRLYPEPFCWAAFLNLVTAGILMERGQLQKTGADPNWPVIVHRDFKLDNTFYGVRDVNNFPMYPRTKLADFGLAITIPPNDTRDLKTLGTRGTEDHAAPEMHARLEIAGVKRRQSTRTNVWGVGIVMFSLLAGKYGPCAKDETWFDWGDQEKREPPELDASAQAFYSRELVNLVMACMRFKDIDRPSFDHLLAEIRKHTTPGENDRAYGLRGSSPKDPDYAAKCAAHIVPFAADKYALGLSYAESGFEGLIDTTTPPDALAGL